MKEFQPGESPTHLLFLLAAPAARLAPELLACLEGMGGRLLNTGENPAVLAVPLAGAESVDKIILEMEQCVSRDEDGASREILRDAEIRLAALNGPDGVAGKEGEEGAAAIPELDLVLETGRAFGSGTHPTTRLCLDAMQELALQPQGFPDALLDVGCGTGVLSLAALRCGARSALGIDHCPETLAVARRNAALNGMAGKARFCASSLEELLETFPLVVANLPAGVLLRLLPRIAGRAARGGMLILAGTGQAAMDEAAQCLQELGFLIVNRSARESWAALVARLTDSPESAAPDPRPRRRRSGP